MSKRMGSKRNARPPTHDVVTPGGLTLGSVIVLLVTEVIGGVIVVLVSARILDQKVAQIQASAESLIEAGIARAVEEVNRRPNLRRHTPEIDLIHKRIVKGEALDAELLKCPHPAEEAERLLKDVDEWTTETYKLVRDSVSLKAAEQFKRADVLYCVFRSI